MNRKPCSIPACPINRAALAAVLLAMLGCIVSVSAQSETQRWEGVLDVQIATLRIQLELEFEDGRFKKGIGISPDQGNARMKIDSLSVNGDEMEFEIKSVGAGFKGKFSDDRTRVVGKFTQGQSFDMEFKRVDGEFAASEHIESWKGTMEAGPQTFDFLLKFYREDDGSISAKLDSINEGLNGLKVELDRDQQKCNFELKVSQAVYEGKFNDDKDRIEGIWKQRGGEYELVFEKTDLNVQLKPNRPQHPRKPYPYLEEEVKFDNDKAGITLAGTLTIPKSGGPFPAVVLISGSGPQDRDETIFEHKPFLVIADHLTRNGMAVLRFDERGVGESTGNIAQATSEDFAEDVEAAINYLQTRDDINNNRIGMIGHSEGGLIAPMIAARRPDIAMIVLLAGPGVDGREIAISQSSAMARAAGAADADVERQEQFMTTVFDELDKKGEVTTEFVEQLVKDEPELRAAVVATIARVENEWFKFFMKYDPRPALKKVKCPVLVLNGKKDLQVLVDLNVDAIAGALKEGGNTRFAIHKLDNLNHLFQKTDGPGLVTEYARIEETFSPKALDIISNWLREVVK